MKTVRLIALVLVAFLIIVCLASQVIGGGPSTSPPATPRGPVFAGSPFSDLDCTHDSIGNAIITGKFTNTSQTTISFVEVEASIYATQGSTGPRLNSDWSYVETEHIGPGDSSRFTIYVDDPDSEMRSCRVEVIDFR